LHIDIDMTPLRRYYVMIINKRGYEMKLNTRVTLRTTEDIHSSISECVAPSEGRSTNQMINILLVEALNARDNKLSGVNAINPITGLFTQ